MTVSSLRNLPAAIFMTTALSWGINAHSAGLGVGIGVNANAQLRANADGGDVRAGNHRGILSDTRVRAMAGASARSDAAQVNAQYQNHGRSAAALSAVTDARVDSSTSVGSQVRSAVLVDGRARSQIKGTAN